MNRRMFLFGGAAVATSALIIDNPIKTIVVGHTKDAISRVTHEDEVLSNAAIELTGKFDETATGRDAAHYADGTVSIVDKDGKTYIQLNEDFTSGPLPDGWVCIHKNGNLQDETDTLTDDLTYIAPLKAGSGAQVYEVNEELTAGMSVVIVCRAFQEYIGAATLN